MELPKRKNIRLTDYDYSQNGYYFITICTHNKLHLFGEIINDEMVLNNNGIIVNNHLILLNERYENVFLDCYAIMPNLFILLLLLRNG